MSEPQASPTAAPRKKAGLSPWLIGCGALAVIGVIGLIVGGIFSAARAFGQATPVATAAPVVDTQPPANTQTSPTAASPATEVAVAIASPTATEAPPVPVPDGMTLIPAGFFQMGSDLSNESPLHPVLLDDFYIDTNEVTNAQYRACVEAGGCSKPASRRNVDDAFAAFPVTGVTWPQANVYCKSRGDRLPTEAEWEYAAGGAEHLRWPWGNKFDASLSAASAADVQPVGSYPGGAGPFGLLDMAGNAAEWVWDTYNPDYYANAVALNPENSAPNEP
ncbi:MAG: SUMF1/EgtB/PvdO family nonheme iron enzyme, partial [Chloroflexi bacterium]|nr:SUMF1/EgtB/PvdO family nonheme iron enzyme [Chloroflexota bacterium]